MCLHSTGTLQTVVYDRYDLENFYDPDLWSAPERTFPHSDKEKLENIILLTTNNGAIIGSYYPGVIYAPARNRTKWHDDPNLHPYLSGEKLSWQSCLNLQLCDNSMRQKFLNRLLGLQALMSGRIKTTLENFWQGDSNFNGLEANAPEKLGKTPDTFPPFPDKIDPNQFLSQYPLKRTFSQNGIQSTVYYLVEGFPEPAPWMREPIGPSLPHFSDYKFSPNGQLVVNFGGRQTELLLQANDKVVLLKDLFLPSNGSFWCKLPGNSNEAQTTTIRNLHVQAITNPGGRFTQLGERDKALCLAPVKSEFLQYFPEVLSAPETHLSVRHESGTENLRWTFKLFDSDKTFSLTIEPTPKDLTGAYLALWPPKVAEQWNLYVVHGKGDKTRHGRWALMDEKGRTGYSVDLPAGEYINILNQPDQFNRPMALCLNDSNDNERGVVFLNPLPGPNSGGGKAELAVDFGTSNTCFAYKLANSQPETLIFELSPKTLWGQEPFLDNPGFVPLKWGGARGFFPTILLSQSGYDFSHCTPQAIQAEHLFRIDIPGLHSELVERLFEGTLPTGWDRHDNMKWELRTGYSPDRNLFLGLTMLYAHAELLFNHGATLDNYVLTYPLAFSLKERENFHSEASQLTQRIRQLCYGDQSSNANYFYNVDESRAIALGIQSPGGSAFMEVFVDIGGGTTDLAIRHNNNILALDSFKVAGGAFFKFAAESLDTRKNRSNGEKFINHLGNLLFADKLNNGGGNTDFLKTINQVLKANNLHLGTFYSLAINRLDDQLFKKRESAILEQKMGWPSFQLYRSQLFFTHIIAYSLIQACAAAVNQKLDPATLTNGIKLIFSGNGWGLMVFAELERSARAIEKSCQDILTTLKKHLLESCTEAEKPYLEFLKIHQVNLLNQTALSVAKTSVAKGALDPERPPAHVAVGKPITLQDNGDRSRPFCGLSFRHLVINNKPLELRWCDRWDKDTLEEKLGMRLQVIMNMHVNDQPNGWEQATNQQLTAFTALGNMMNQTEDPLPSEEWVNINTRLCNSKPYLNEGKLSVSPLNFLLSEILYSNQASHLVLEKMAELNGTL